jgi:hypothetical protein
VKSEDNTSDILTKYLQAHLHRTHTKYLHLLLPQEKTNKNKQAQTATKDNITQQHKQQRQRQTTLTSRHKDTQEDDGQSSHCETPEQLEKSNKKKTLIQGGQVSKRNNDSYEFQQCTLKITKHNTNNTCEVVQVHQAY